MTQTTGRFFDELGKLITDAAGAADGVRKEVENVVRSQAERVLRDLDVVQREEFEAVKAMAQKAREENDALKARISALEAAIVKGLADNGYRRAIGTHCCYLTDRFPDRCAADPNWPHPTAWGPHLIHSYL